MMKIITRYDKKIGEEYSYCVYLFEESNRPFKVFTAENKYDRNCICENLIVNFNISSVEHVEGFSIDLSDTEEYIKE